MIMILIIFLFMYIFGFNLPVDIDILNSSIILGLILGLYFSISPKYRSTVIGVLQRKKVLFIFVFLLGIILYSLSISTIQLTYEYSIIRSLLNQMINLFIGILLYSLYVYKGKVDLIVHHIIYIFIIQSSIQLISFIFPPINEFLNIFRNESAVILGTEQYGGIRALSVSGQAFFGLGVGFGLVYIYYFLNWKYLFSNYKVIKILFLLLLIFGGTSAARSSYVGLVLGIIYLLVRGIFRPRVYRQKNINFRKGIISLIVTSVVFLSILVSLSGVNTSQDIKEQFDRLNRYALQMVYNYQESGRFSTSSTTRLFDEMYFNIEEAKTFLIGDAIYTNEDGSYYMHTDAGYMRNILYFGLIGIIILFFYQTKFFHWKRKTDWFQNGLIITYVLIMHVKGDILGYSIIMQNILFFVFLSNLDFNTVESGRKSEGNCASQNAS